MPHCPMPLAFQSQEETLLVTALAFWGLNWKGESGINSATRPGSWGLRTAGEDSLREVG
jgi:hypothetical protein